eukprot:CAMPEP_0174849718 /NCGR_PEP_ID=MMETSP1114-20130205/16938_1 /TAXON_ID=312471 /ORGANISM="Neobodo designis, Strain CCAP 1951/1" /LENGTH=297 /DNA_ID=CAMNT_0016084107 /DNA_START=126 /DNA_END=1019 /DNA_ORIENTATION=+
MTTSPHPDVGDGGMSRQQSAISHTPSTPRMSAQQSWAGINTPEVVHAASAVPDPAPAPDDDSTRSCSPDNATDAVPLYTPDPLVTPAQAAALLESWIEDDGPAVATGCHLLDTMTLRNLPPLSIKAFAERVFTYGACEPTCYAVALALINRLRTSPVGAHCNPLCTSGSGSKPAHAGSDDDRAGSSGADDDGAAASGSLDSERFCAWYQARMCAHSGRPGVSITRYNVHRAFATAVVLAIKSTQDVYHPMSYYGAVFGVSAVDLRRMEAALMTVLDHHLYVRRAEAEAIVQAAALLE